ncbi:protein kinase [Candidatus Uabimicrobium sp. HlEnr_7]|uniref:serine/threonine-protein kinase n=1 Tax=Candidatus Uabimicrobium helgolandensis TaxID=3095367 RepID=UPI003558ADF4
MQSNKFLQYTIVEKIGQGGVGTVYKCIEDVSQRVVAVKFLLPRAVQNISRKRFLREANILGALNHPSIVKIYNAGEFKGKLFIVMELLEGMTLKSTDTSSWSFTDKVDIVQKIAQALNYTHKQQITHRDIKPENIFITRDLRPIVLDFGLAKKANIKSKKLTKTGDIIGTAHYMSPEQVNGEKLDGQTDIYALGAVLFELLYEKKMIPGTTNMEILLNSLKLKRATVNKKLVPYDLDLICTKATSSKKLRYATMDNFLQDLQDFAKGNKAKGLREFKFRMVLKKSIPFVIGILFFMSIFFLKNQSVSIQLTTTKDYILSIENLLLNQQYEQARILLNSIEKNSDSYAQQLRILKGRTLLGLKEYSAFSHEYSNIDISTNWLLIIATIEMYCDQENYNSAQLALNNLPNNSLQYLQGISSNDMKHYLQGKVYFFTEKMEQAYIEFSKITTPKKLFSWYPSLYYYLGIISSSKEELPRAFSYFQQAYKRQPNKSTLYEMSKCVISFLGSQEKIPTKLQKEQVEFCILALQNTIAVEPSVGKLYYYLGVIKYNYKQNAYQDLIRAAELGERKQIFDILLKICKNDFYKYQQLLKTFRYIFRYYERFERPDIFEEVIQEEQKKYERDYYRNQLATKTNSYKNTVSLLKRAPEATQKTIVESLPVTESIARLLKTNYPTLYKDHYQQKSKRLIRYYLTYLYFVDNLQMQNEIKLKVEEVLSIAKDKRENAIIRYLAMRMLLRVYDYENLHMEKFVDETGQIINSLVAFRHGLINISAQVAKDMWEKCSGLRSTFLGNLLIDSFIERHNTSLVGIVPSDFSEEASGILYASYLYLLSENSGAETHLRSVIAKQKNKKLTTYAYYMLLQKISIKDIAKQKTYTLGLSTELLTDIALKAIVYELETIPLPKNSLVVKENVGGIFKETFFKKTLSKIMRGENFTITSLSARIWSKLPTVKDNDLLSYLNDDNTSIVMRSLTYFYFMESNPGIFMNHFLKNIENIGKVKIPEIIKTYGLLPEETPINIRFLLEHLENPTLKILLYRQMQEVFLLSSFEVLRGLKFSYEEYKEFLSSHVIHPLSEAIYDFHPQAVCDHIDKNPFPFINDFFVEICKSLPDLHRKEIDYRKELRKEILKQLKKHFNRKTGLDVYLAGVAIYTPQNECLGICKQSLKKLSIEKQKQVALGFYIRAKRIIYKLDTKKMRKLFLKKNRLQRTFPFRGSNLYKDRYTKDINLLKAQSNDIIDTVAQNLDYALSLDHNSKYLFERAVVYRAQKKYEKAVELLEKALLLRASPHYLLEKIEIKSMQNKLTDELCQTLTKLESRTTNRMFLKRIAKIYATCNKKKSRQLYQQLFIEDPYDISCVEHLINMSSTISQKHWSLSLSVIKEKIKRQKLPLD